MSRPSKIKSKLNWKLKTAIELGEYIFNNFYFLEIPRFWGDESKEFEKSKKFLKLASSLESNSFKEFLLKEQGYEIQDLERVRDFIRFEMFEEDHITTAIKNEDIERIIFYSLLEIPKKTLINVESNDEVILEKPVERAPYFAIMAIQTEIILQLLATLDVYDNKELIIKSWVINQIVDPLDKNRLTGEIYNKAMKDERFFEEIYSGLYILLEKTFLNLEKLGGDIELLIKIIDETFFIILSNYFLDQKESAFTLMKQINDELNLT